MFRLRSIYPPCRSSSEHQGRGCIRRNTRSGRQNVDDEIARIRPSIDRNGLGSELDVFTTLVDNRANRKPSWRRGGAQPNRHINHPVFGHFKKLGVRIIEGENLPVLPDCNCVREIAYVDAGRQRCRRMCHRDGESLGAFADVVLLEDKIDVLGVHVAVARNGEFIRVVGFSIDGDIIGDSTSTDGVAPVVNTGNSGSEGGALTTGETDLKRQADRHRIAVYNCGARIVRAGKLVGIEAGIGDNIAILVMLVFGIENAFLRRCRQSAHKAHAGIVVVDREGVAVLAAGNRPARRKTSVAAILTNRPHGDGNIVVSLHAIIVGNGHKDSGLRGVRREGINRRSAGKRETRKTAYSPKSKPLIHQQLRRACRLNGEGNRNADARNEIGGGTALRRLCNQDGSTALHQPFVGSGGSGGGLGKRQGAGHVIVRNIDRQDTAASVG